MHKALVFCFFLYVPQPQSNIYAAWWHQTGINHGAPKETVAVVKPCRLVYRHEQNNFKKFCNNSGRYLQKYKGNKFCLTTGLLTRERCEDVLEQNVRNKRVIWRLIED